MTLDPHNWEEFRTQGHVVLDDMINYLKSVEERPVWQSPSKDARAALSRPVPREGSALNNVYETFKQSILPYPTGNIHPRFWGWVMGTGTPVGLLADLMASTLNCHVSGYDQGASLVEHQVLEWLTELMDFPKGSSGLLVSGGTVANLVGVTVARNHATGQRIRNDGVKKATAEGDLVFYGSTATHGWAGRCCDLLGLGESAFRKASVDARHRVCIDDMAMMIHQDRARGLKPCCIVGNAGTVSCGATDDLHALADLADREGLWFHVDGAFGALVKLSTKYRHLASGIERADSLAFDLHKWGYMQYEAGCILVRDARAHADSFSFGASYLESFRGGIAVEPTEFASRGIQLSRGFQALKIWMNLSVYGSERIGQEIERNVDDVAYLCALLRANAELEILGPAEMNIVCFRYVSPGRSLAQLDAMNAELLIRLQESGLAVPSNARIDGKFAVRVANTNHRTTRSDFDLLVESVVSLGRELSRTDFGNGNRHLCDGARAL